MEIKKLSDTDLNLHLKTLAQKERELLHEILLVLREIDTRRLYLSMGYANFFEYLVKGIGYSEGSAQRRIDASRLLKDVPDLGRQIESGKVTLNQISVVQKAIRQIRKTAKSVSATEKQELISNLADKNHQETQHLVAQYFDLHVQSEIKQTTQADESVRIEMTLSKEQFALLERAKALLSHSVPSGDLVQFISHVCEKIIAQKTRHPSDSKSKLAEKIDSTISIKKAVPSKTSTATVAVKTKAELLQSQKVCQYKDPITHHKCESLWQLQIDHIQPRWAGGSNEKSNLQILCANHNLDKYRKQAGLKRV